jgi:hypothetical protein
MGSMKTGVFWIQEVFGSCNSIRLNRFQNMDLVPSDVRNAQQHLPDSNLSAGSPIGGILAATVVAIE